MTSLWGSKGTLLKCLIQEERWGLALEGSAQEGFWWQLPTALQVWTDGQRNVQNWRGCADCTLECLHYQHASVTSQHHVVQCVWGRAKKKIPTMSVLPLGILPLGGHRGCLPSLPGHSTLREPKTRKVLTNPAAQWGRAKTKKQSTQERYTHTGPPSTPPKVHCSWPTAQNWLLVSWVSRQTESLWKLMKYTLPLSCSCNTLQRQRFRP